MEEVILFTMIRERICHTCSVQLINVAQLVGGPADSLHFIAKSAMFHTNLNLKNKVDLIKYKIMRDFMIKRNLCDVLYNKNPVDPLQRTSEFVYQSSIMNCHLYVIAEPSLDLPPHFSITGDSNIKGSNFQKCGRVRNIFSLAYNHYL